MVTENLFPYEFLIINKGNEKNLNFASGDSIFETCFIDKVNATQPLFPTANMPGREHQSSKECGCFLK